MPTNAPTAEEIVEWIDSHSFAEIVKTPTGVVIGLQKTIPGRYREVHATTLKEALARAMGRAASDD